MGLHDSVSAAAKKEYKEFEKEVGAELETKLKTYLSNFQNFLDRTAFKKEEED